MTATRPGFKTIPGPVTGTIPAATEGDGFGDSSPGEDSPPATRSFPASTDPEVDLEAEEGYRKLLSAMGGQVVYLASMLVRVIRARRRQLPPKVWIATKADQKAIGEPLARIAARHAPMAGKGSDDLVDGFAAGVAGVGYALTNLEAEEAAAGEQLPDVDEDQDVTVDDAGRAWVGVPPGPPVPYR